MSLSFAQSGNTILAEKIAEEYLSAFYQGDLNKAAELTHPDQLNTLKLALLSEINSGRLPEQEFRSMAEISDEKELDTLSPKFFFITMQKANRKGSPAEFLNSMKNAKIKASKSNILSSGLIEVLLSVTSLRPDGNESTQQTPIYVKRDGDAFKVTMP